MSNADRNDVDTVFVAFHYYWHHLDDDDGMMMWKPRQTSSSDDDRPMICNDDSVQISCVSTAGGALGVVAFALPGIHAPTRL